MLRTLVHPSSLLIGRATDSPGKLLNHFELIETPLQLTMIVVPTVPLPKVPCPGDCFPVFRGDLGRREIFVPPYAELPLAPLTNGPAVLALDSAKRVLAHRFFDRRVVDVGAGVSTGVVDALGSDSLYFLSPVEPAYRIKNAAVQFVTMPRDWSATSSLGAGIASSRGLFLQGEQPHPQSLALACSGSTPCARTGARGLYSANWQRVFLAGGRAMDVPTAEIWEYLFEQSSWSRLLFEHKQTHKAGERTVDPAPGDVRALAFDDVLGRLIVLDEIDEVRKEPKPNVTKVGSPASPDDKKTEMFKVRRIVVVDMHSRDATVVFWQELRNKNERADLVAMDDGGFALTLQRADGASWWAHRFFIEDGLAKFAGVAHGEGRVVQPPLRVAEGILMLVSRSGVEHLLSLDAGAFDSSSGKDFAPDDM